MLKEYVRHISPKYRIRIAHSLAFRVLERLRQGNRNVDFRCELTTKCNCNCAMCTRVGLLGSGVLPVDDMEENVLKRVLEEMKLFYAAGYNVSFATMGLGEPLLFGRLFDVFARIKDISHAIRIIVVTNGVLMDKTVCHRLIEMGVDEVTVSLNSSSAEDYSRRMGVDKFTAVIDNIRRLLEIRNESCGRYPSVIVQYLDEEGLMSRHDRDIMGWKTLMRYDDKCYIHPIVNQGGNVRFSTFAKGRSPFPCSMPLRYIAIGRNGDIYPCDACFYAGGRVDNSLCIGNIMKDSPYELKKRSDNPWSRIVRMMRRGDYSGIPGCAECNNYKLSSNIYFKVPFGLKYKGNKWV